MKFNTDILNDFEPVSLQEMDTVSLLDRADTKYVFHLSELNKILDSLKPHYYILEVRGERLSEYHSVYYDDDDYTFYHKHHNTYGERFKVRFREYLNSGAIYFEVKKKINTNRTIKNRMPCSVINHKITGEEKTFYESLTSHNADTLQPKVEIDYSRITLVNNEFSERATFDLFVTFRNNGRARSFGELVIAEVKQLKLNHESPVTQKLKSLHINSASLSKYCIGIYELCNDVKKNNFKPQLHHINKVLNR